MGTIRASLIQARGRVAALLALTLLLRLMVPSGFMPVADARGLAIVACDGTGPVAMPGMAHHHGSTHQHATICDFAALGWADAGADGVTLPPPPIPGFAALPTPPDARLAVIPADRLRPPLRAPPLA